MAETPLLPVPDRLLRLERALEDQGYPVVRAEPVGGARALLIDRGDARRAALVSCAIAERDPAAEIARLRALAPSRPLAVIACGPRPDAIGTERLRAAGVTLWLEEPADAQVLRFQMNRALGPEESQPRGALRAPLGLEVSVRSWLKTQEQRLYTLSAAGAYLLCDRPLRAGRRVALEFPVGMLRPRTRARVVLANPPGAGKHPGLPPGMALSFFGLDAPAAAVIDRLVAERLAALAL
jgi:hypothetical protein